MIGLGTVINVCAIVIGGLGGLMFGRKLSGRYQDTLMSAIGLCTLFLGISGAMQHIMFISNGGLATQGTMMMISCYALGSLLGEWLNLEKKIEQFGEWLKQKTGNAGDMGFVDAFVTASLTVCVGAMAVVGSIQDGIAGDYSVLAAKAALDLVIIMVMTASLGKGCIFSAIPVGLFQGAITLLAGFVKPLITDAAMSNLSLTGSMLIFCVGVNLFFNKKVKVANMLPSIFLAVAWAFVF